METALRNDLYAHLQRLPVASTTAGSPGSCSPGPPPTCRVIRRFLSFGLIFLVINLATFITVVALLLHLLLAARAPGRARARCRCSGSASGSPGGTTRCPGGCRTSRATWPPWSRRPPAASGSSRRSAGAITWRPSSTSAPERLYDTAVGKTRMVAPPGRSSTWCPTRRSASCWSAARSRSRPGTSRVGELVAFVSLQLMLIWPIDALGYIIANAQEAMTAADRIYEVLDTEPTIVDRPGAVALRRADGTRGACGSRASSFGYPGATGAGAARGRPGGRAGRDAGHRRRHRLRQDHAGHAGAPADRPDRRPDHARRPRHPRHHPRLAALGGRRRLRGGDAVLDERAGEPHPGPARRHRRRRSPRRSRSPRPTSCTTCRGG